MTSSQAMSYLAEMVAKDGKINIEYVKGQMFQK